MESTKLSRLRKRLMSEERTTRADGRTAEIDIAGAAMIAELAKTPFANVVSLRLRRMLWGVEFNCGSPINSPILTS